MLICIGSIGKGSVRLALGTICIESRLPLGTFSIGPYANLHRTLCKKVSGVGHGSRLPLRVELLSGVPSLQVAPRRRLGKAFDMHYAYAALSAYDCVIG